MERAAPGSPIWPCTRWGFPCLRAYAWSGGLLPHLFTLTSPSFPRPRRSKFLWHFPSGRLTASPPACISPPAFLRRPGQLRGIAPYGVRTFLLPRIASGKAILRPSKIKVNISGWQRHDKRNQGYYSFPGVNQFLNGGMMRLRCMRTLRIAAEPPCTTASAPNLSPGYGFGPPTTICRHRGAEHRRSRKYLGANGMP
jgi:hypothetical protein